ncbi:UDP-glucosyltransferase 2 [Frankliniella fusca]|uniref:UDP-glucuronosyltransferase n=1 Tax=Frankliniella fusca TaxID=407009 RepID=A0AAE1LDN5_9NEOP|nr:UDP-glucosyltransferase 2 [Frankliniella fusca]
MKTVTACVLVGLLCAAAAPAEGLRVLGLFPLPGHSHNVFFKAFMETLAERGHQVVVFSPFPHKKPLANYTDVDTSNGAPSFTNNFSFNMVSSVATYLPGQAMYNSMTRIGALSGPNLCRQVFSMPEFDKLMRGGYGRFDVVFTEVFGSDCWAAVAHKMQLPLISMSSAPDVSWMHERFGSPDNPSYLVNVFTGYTSAMSLWQRLINACTAVYVNYLHKIIMQEPSEAVVKEFFGPDMPPISEMIKNTSLLLLNRHMSIHAARPVPPNVLHVGGLHIKPSVEETLDPELLRWMDEAEHGVIFFSLGSMMRSDTLPRDKRDALLGAFSKLPQRVLWKFETPDIELPPNVRIGKWLPQLAILTHPKTILFMTHGGLMGTLEALHSSVPMLGIPLFADQMSNTELYRSLGIAQRLDIRTATEESTLAVLRELTETSKYRDRAREVARLFRDRPRQALDEAVWWTEYVVRNHGARHLRPLGADLAWYEYLLLDVAAVLLAAALLVLVVLRAALRAVLGAFRGGAPVTARQRKPKKE